MRKGRILIGLAAAWSGCPSAMGQFGTPASTPVRERLVGRLLVAEGVPAVAAGDQVGAFFQNRLVGAFTFSSGDEFSMVVFGDNPNTSEKEGPATGDAVQFRFYDASTNETRTDVRAENLQGERFNYRYQGAEIPVDLPFPIDLTPTRNINLRVGATNTGGNTGGERAKFDVNGDGKIDEADVAAVLRLVIGASRGASDAVIKAADVNGDKQVTTDDAIEIMRNK